MLAVEPSGGSHQRDAADRVPIPTQRESQRKQKVCRRSPGVLDHLGKPALGGRNRFRVLGQGEQACREGRLHVGSMYRRVVLGQRLNLTFDQLMTALGRIAITVDDCSSEECSAEQELGPRGEVLDADRGEPFPCSAA